MKNRLEIIYEDDKVIVVFKKSGYLTIATEKEKIKTLYHDVKEYLNKKKQKVFIVHRLDKDTSGLVIFAKDIDYKCKLQKEFEEHNVVRLYECCVKEKVNPSYKKKVRQFLFYDLKSGLSFPTTNKKRGKEAITEVEFSNYLNDYSVLKIHILTGRQNQIRVALKTLKLTLIGDKKYANDSSSFMHLNFYYLKFNNPVLKVNEFLITPFWLKKDQ